MTLNLFPAQKKLVMKKPSIWDWRSLASENLKLQYFFKLPKRPGPGCSRNAGRWRSRWRERRRVARSKIFRHKTGFEMGHGPDRRRNGPNWWIHEVLSEIHASWPRSRWVTWPFQNWEWKFFLQIRISRNDSFLYSDGFAELFFEKLRFLKIYLSIKGLRLKF